MPAPKTLLYMTAVRTDEIEVDASDFDDAPTESSVYPHAAHQTPRDSPRAPSRGLPALALHAGHGFTRSPVSR